METTPALVYLDSHVHLYDLFDLEGFFDHALENFHCAAQGQRNAPSSEYVLFLTRSTKDRGIRRISEGRYQGTLSRWKIQSTEEEGSLVALGNGGRILLCPGLQIVAEERIEVLALGCDADIPDGLPIKDILGRVREEGAIPVLPWGVGKWMGKRGELVAGLIREGAFPELFLGDNSGRPRFWSTPSLFRLNPDLRVLPGSDPLPLASQIRVPARYGLRIDCDFDAARPTQSILSALRNRSFSACPFGRREGALSFFYNQAAVQLQNRRGA